MSPTSPHRRLSEFVMPYVTAVITLVLLITVILVHKQSQEASDRSTDLRSALIANCEKNGNPLRDAMQALIKDQIEQSKAFTPEQAAQFFPNVPKEDLDALTKASIQRNRELLATIPDLDCVGIFENDE